MFSRERGQIWRRDGAGEETTDLKAGVSIDIPVGTAFQYRCTGIDPLRVSLHLNAALARRQGGDGHRGALETDCSRLVCWSFLTRRLRRVKYQRFL